ncbi:hypothetical protein ERO13_D05G264200v2 [Gossypium hirsutum]|uniref:non-specific serine/threonine protein kinase n=1 Tax=Gossypium hirsutum TaxID=3635 RepID=A0ABM3A699_GOSHI|nr:probable serine/threonine-protein kinase At1g01540 isoform X2 [Gossypium hirsutum]KAG4148080.1 hypothetical protein ERO13_D05G264200v2 [Gossypium hirsutum]KAG4148081.1 hypothetical protein ERO13_D05G264200v2 [Gossypium hirsutum]
MSGYSFLNDQLSKRTSIFSLQLWVVLGLCVGAAIVIVLFLVSLWITCKRQNKATCSSNNVVKPILNSSIPIASKEFQEIRVEPSHHSNPVLLPESDPVLILHPEEGSGAVSRCNGIHIEIGKDHKVASPERGSGSSHGSGEARCSDQGMTVRAVPEVSHLGWGHWYTLRELEESTNDFAADNVIGEGGYGIVYRGVLEDNSKVAVKNLLNNRGQAEKEFKVEVEAIGRVRHKNLVRLLGYCAEGAHRLAYLHEGLEPKVVHRDIKSSNILLDKQWNPKVSDFGLAKLLGSGRSYVTTRVMGTFGYVAPEYASTGMLNERSDVYSFGILLMEIISGRTPVDYSRPQGEVNLVEWIKSMVSNRNAEGVLDPRLPEKPSSRALKRALLVALRCVDPNAQKRPKMGHVIHMLEADEFPFRDERKDGRENMRSLRDDVKNRLTDKRVNESGDSSGYESGAQTNRSLWRKQES